MRRMYTGLLTAVMVLLGASVSTMMTPAVAAEGTAVIVTPANGSTYQGQFTGPIVIDLSQAGAVEPTDTFEVSYTQTGTAGSTSLGTISGTDAATEVALAEPLPLRRACRGCFLPLRSKARMTGSTYSSLTAVCMTTKARSRCSH